jgi:DNA primase
MIESNIVQKIIDTADIVEVLSDFITLKKSGTNYKGVCPFHNEKTPSFMVSPAKNIFKCFGCGEAGSPVNFVMKHEKISFVDAIKYLGRKYHIEIIETEQTDEEKEKFQERESLNIVTSYAQKYFTDILHNTSKGKAIGMSYFKERGFTNDTIQKFQLGYSPEDKTALTDEAIKQGYKLEFLEKTGLTIVKENYKFDRFSGRVIFPIHSISGRVVGFGGRVLKKDKDTAKYLNSPESDIYHKSRELYGIFFAKSSIVKHDKCFMVEGYTDVISMHQAGIENVVASSGTSLTEDQIRLVKRFTENLTIIYDGDAAGIKASLRGIDKVLEEGMKVRIVPLPPEEDPDSFSKNKTTTQLINYIEENEVDFLTFKMKLLSEEAEKDPIKRAGIITEIVGTISLIPDTFLRSEYVKEAAKVFSIDENTIYGEIKKKFYRKSGYSDNKIQTEYKKTTQYAQIPGFIDKLYSEVEEREIIYYLLNFGDEVFETYINPINETVSISVAEFIIREIQNDDSEFKNLIYKQIFEECQQNLMNFSKIDENTFINHPDEKIGSLAANLLSPGYTPSAIWSKKGSYVETPEMTFKKDIPKSITTFKLKIIQMALEDINNQIKNLNTVDEERLIELIGKNMLINQIKVDLAKETGNRTIL